MYPHTGHASHSPVENDQQQSNNRVQRSELTPNNYFTLLFTFTAYRKEYRETNWKLIGSSYGP